MFRCEMCGKVVGPSVKCNKVVTEKKLVDHEHRRGVFRGWDEEKGRAVWVDDPGGRGFQIVKELDTCPTCAEEYTATHPE